MCKSRWKGFVVHFVLVPLNCLQHRSFVLLQLHSTQCIAPEKRFYVCIQQSIKIFIGDPKLNHLSLYIIELLNLLVLLHLKTKTRGLKMIIFISRDKRYIWTKYYDFNNIISTWTETIEFCNDVERNYLVFHFPTKFSSRQQIKYLFHYC